MADLKILLVDDALDFLEVISARMQSWGYEPITASSGKEALDVMKDKNVDVVILDYKMPEMDGLATLKEIRKVNKDIPVIMMTAYPEMKTIKGAEKLGVNVFIPKLSAYSDTQKALKEAIHMVEEKLDREAL